MRSAPEPATHRWRPTAIGGTSAFHEDHAPGPADRIVRAQAAVRRPDKRQNRTWSRDLVYSSCDTVLGSPPGPAGAVRERLDPRLLLKYALLSWCFTDMIHSKQHDISEYQNKRCAMQASIAPDGFSLC